MLGHADAECRELFLKDRGERILDPPACNLAAGRDDGGGLQFVGQKLQNGSACRDAVGGVELFFADNERNDARAAEFVTGVNGGVRVAGGDHQLIDHVDGVEPFHVHTEQPVAVSAKLDLALPDLAARHVLVFADGAKTLGGIVFVKCTRLHLPDVQVLLAH